MLLLFDRFASPKRDQLLLLDGRRRVRREVADIEHRSDFAAVSSAMDVRERLRARSPTFLIRQ
jgi:hypothetical protein